MSLIIKAAQLAAQLHKGQVRKYTGRPYIEHPMRVAGRTAMQPDVNESVVAAAWLHDVIEDCNVTGAALHSDKYRMPATTVGLVEELTNPSKAFPQLSREVRKSMDRKHLAGVSYWAKVIKLLDRIDNIRDTSTKDIQFKWRYGHETRQLVEALLPCEEVLIRDLATELTREVDKLLE